VSLSRRDIVELYEVRQALEGLACMMATERMTDLELDQLEALLDVHEKDPLLGRAHSRSSPKPDFHFVIAHGSRNQQLIELLCGQMFDLMRVYRYKSSGAPGRTRRAFDEHRQIVAAMRLRDADRASLLMQKHVRQSKLNLMREDKSADAEMFDLDLGTQNSLLLRGLGARPS
jgi:DNA-binding GntR family transcriptional regulator